MHAEAPSEPFCHSIPQLRHSGTLLCHSGKADKVRGLHCGAADNLACPCLTAGHRRLCYRQR